MTTASSAAAMKRMEHVSPTRSVSAMDLPRRAMTVETAFRALLPVRKIHPTQMTCAHLTRDINANMAMRLFVIISITHSNMKSYALATTAPSIAIPTPALYLALRLNQSKVKTVHLSLISHAATTSFAALNLKEEHVSPIRRAIVMDLI